MRAMQKESVRSLWGSGYQSCFARASTSSTRLKHVNICRHAAYSNCNPYLLITFCVKRRAVVWVNFVLLRQQENTNNKNSSNEQQQQPISRCSTDPVPTNVTLRFWPAFRCPSVRPAGLRSGHLSSDDDNATPRHTGNAP
ncbi:uncharacterized protein [Drosophila pseudoobscura]|uniref:Uncharacterized protein n=1 Tax=Drosophila pseudoobscura pseudoobscura TaxID=46245 RepID=A0A6I8VYA7_DROPS|nr:uncharacterized protein LOC117184043 [Drosophila pseudoobscura]